MGVLSNQTEFWYMNDANGTQIEGLMEVPALGGTSEKIEITTLEDTARQYMKGITSYGDSLDFKFLYDGGANGNYATLSALTGTKSFKVKFDIDGSTGHSFTFLGEPSVAMDAISVNSALTFTLSIAPRSPITYA